MNHEKYLESLKDDGIQKEWQKKQIAIREARNLTDIFDIERLHQGLDETIKPKSFEGKDDEISKKLKEIILKYEAEDDPDFAFGEACMAGNIEDAEFLLVHYLQANDQVSTVHNNVTSAIQKIFKRWNFDMQDLHVLYWLFSKDIVTVEDSDIVYLKPRVAIWKAYIEEAKVHPDYEHLHQFVLNQIKQAHEEAIPLMIQAICDFIMYVKEGTPFEAKSLDNLDKLVPDGKLVEGTYGLNLQFLGKTLYLKLMHDDGLNDSISFSIPMLDGYNAEASHPYIQKLLAPELENLYKEGLFDDVFSDVIIIRDDSNKEVLFRHDVNSAELDQAYAHFCYLETSEDWLANIDDVAVAVERVHQGKLPMVEAKRALALAKRYLYCPDGKVSNQALDIFHRNQSRSDWLAVRAQYYHDILFFDRAMNDAQRVKEDAESEAADQLYNNFILAEKRRNILTFDDVNPAFSIKSNAVEHAFFEDTFKPTDLFVESEHIIARAYRNGDMVIRFIIEGEQGYSEALDFINNLLDKGYAYKVENPSMHGGYSILVRFLHEPLPIVQMAGAIDKEAFPFNDNHAFFARAVQYPKLREKVDTYAKLALRKYQNYTDLDEEKTTVCGTFATIALAFCDAAYLPLVCTYAQAVDEEHSKLHLVLPKLLVKHYGIIPEIMPAIFAISMANGQDQSLHLPKNLIQDGTSARSLLAYIKSLDMDLRSTYEHVVHALPRMIGSPDAFYQSIDKLDNQETKDGLASLYNFYARAYNNVYNYRKNDTQLPLIALHKEEGDVQTDTMLSEMDSVPGLYTATEVKQMDIDVKGITSQVKKAAFIFCSPALQGNFEHLHFTRVMWEKAGLRNQEKGRKKYESKFLSGLEDIKIGKWIVSTKYLTTTFALILFDGKNKPVVLNGIFDPFDTMDAFIESQPQTERELEHFRLEHLHDDAPLVNTLSQRNEVENLLHQATGNLLLGNMTAAYSALQRVNKEDKDAYVASKVMMAYLAQRRGDANQLAQLATQLIDLQPEKAIFWKEKQLLAESI